jgi:hypothetical protein
LCHSYHWLLLLLLLEYPGKAEYALFVGRWQLNVPHLPAPPQKEKQRDVFYFLFYFFVSVVPLESRLTVGKRGRGQRGTRR